MHEPEKDIWDLVRNGDRKAFEEAFRRWYKPLCMYALPIIRDNDEAEETVQNVYYNIWTKREQIRITGSLKSYLYRAVHNECLNKLKHGRVRAAYAEDYRASATIQAEERGIEHKELGREISAALESLPEQCGLVFRMNRFEHLKYAEIAEKLNISVKTVESHMGKALKILRVRLAGYLQLILWFILIR